MVTKMPENRIKLYIYIYIYINILRENNQILKKLNSKLKLILNLLLLGENRELETT